MSLRGLYVLIRHMPHDNPLAQTMGEGWCETDWLAADIGETLRDVQKTLIAISPFVEKKDDLDEVTRPSIIPPERRIASRNTREADTRHRARERAELLAIATGQ